MSAPRIPPFYSFILQWKIWKMCCVCECWWLYCISNTAWIHDTSLYRGSLKTSLIKQRSRLHCHRSMRNLALKGLLLEFYLTLHFKIILLRSIWSRMLKITSFFYLEKCSNAPVTFGKKQIEKSVFRRKKLGFLVHICLDNVYRATLIQRRVIWNYVFDKILDKNKKNGSAYEHSY